MYAPACQNTSAVYVMPEKNVHGGLVLTAGLRTAGVFWRGAGALAGSLVLFLGALSHGGRWGCLDVLRLDLGEFDPLATEAELPGDHVCEEALAR